MKAQLQKQFFSLALTMLAFLLNAHAQYTIGGEVKDSPFTQWLTGARMTLFNSDTSYFKETRVTSGGVYSFQNVPAGDYTIGAEYVGQEYGEISATVNSDFFYYDFNLEDETQPGVWNIIIQSPEALGGTNLGVLLPDGKTMYCHNTREPFYFDPIANDTVACVGSDSVQGCVGPLLNNDGKLWFFGGTLQEVYGPGSKKVKWFNTSTSQWQFQNNMLDYRWYPTLTHLPDGRVLIAGGGGLNNPTRTNTSEVYDLTTEISTFTDTLAIGNEVSPIVVLYNGQVLMTHRPPQLFDPVTNQWNLAADFVQETRMPNGDHSDHELVLMPDGEVIAVGYKSFIQNDYGTFIERYNPDLNEWSLGTSVLPIRSRAKTLLLPDKKILVIGGYKEDSTDTTSTNQYGYMNLCDEYNPATDSWRQLDRLNYSREYHCNAILVPDGRVIAVGGEGQPGNEPPFSVIEAFTPPYLFRGIRPEIANLSSTTFSRGAQINFDVLKTDSVTEVILMSNALVTHFMNSGNNRYLSLPFSQNGNAITAQLPADSLKLLPGFYMLFAMVDDIPSIASIIRVQDSTVFTSIEQQGIAGMNIEIFPNPANNAITILNSSIEKSSEIEITIADLSGRILNVMKVHNSKDQFSTINFSNGIYFLTVADSESSVTRKMIIQHN